MIGKGTRLQVDRWLTMGCSRRCSAARLNPVVIKLEIKKEFSASTLVQDAVI
jgi:hypothetical protein